MSKLNRVRNLLGKSRLTEIENIEARMGVVWVTLKNGASKTLTPRFAARLAVEIASLPMKDTADKIRTQELFTKAQKAAVEALHQQEEPKDSVTAAVANVLAGKKADGTPIRVLTPDDEAKCREWALLYPLMNVRELAVVMKTDFPLYIKEGMIRDVHQERLKLKGVGFGAPI